MKKLIRHFKLQFISLAIVVIGFQSCSENKEANPVVPVTNQRGEILQTNNLGNYSVSNIQQILSSGNITIPFTLTYSVNAISINYYTIDGKGKETVASGALLIPQGINNLPLVSIQHGTQTKDNLVASVSPMNSTEGIVGLIMASMGYMVVVPDYPGFGVSNIMHPYLHAKSLIPSVIDMMRAGKTYSSRHQIMHNSVRELKVLHRQSEREVLQRDYYVSLCDHVNTISTFSWGFPNPDGLSFRREFPVLGRQ